MILDWVTASLISAAILAIVNVVDSHLLAKRLPSVQSYLLILGFIVLIISIVMIILFPLPKPLDDKSLLMAILSGLLRAVSIYILFYTLQREEVSMVIPITNSYPILVAIFAMPIVGEFLDISQWAAIIIVVLGVILASFRDDSGSKITCSSRVLGLLFVSSVLWALSEVTAKSALTVISPWQMYALSHFSMSFIFILISLRPHILREFTHYKKRKSAIVIIMCNETLAVVSIVLFYWAMERGPVSLVSAIASTRPVFVFIYAFIISRFSELLLERRTSKGVLILRFIATAMIVGGISIIYLS